ncbi:bifunctional adenosylcobinamide kinase/adenosylcobinamide-phosphate guanylyltransferase [Cohnella thailandensis]|uniref:Bifunctional adenosylcobinamide kinase/adenosylcobinamide-phosphate guanylyltransferase n=1 Tax=Cohnella thailandensis TaxID=557557 RepID=A0A841SU19_9BACL|nr:bifunctional adenosylcobinamide kinase/adenosylcobinamide-phosphate guanylyltransferase [Cohnella thailandensis]MBB6633718.1 bifunctional adenosylcobinamide kinase/adenosylcobinamide-phosphate guanylyltransferase [Cohnella thailandensis]MBP1976506.1 adenosyl cobinamide kinase/adenosyl cobinamide phosphate guanylyltransferase [Cohnella thailandensis]
MLWMVTGGVGCGKSAYAEKWATTLGREAILLSCPAWPNGRDGDPDARGSVPPKPEGDKISWMSWKADDKLSERLDQINLKSNPFRADSRVIVLDSLSGWLRKAIYEARKEPVLAAPADPPKRGRRRKLPETEEVFKLRTDKVGKEFRRVVDALLRYHGRRIIVTEQPSLGLEADPWERWFAGELAAANRRLAERSTELRLLVSGVAMEIGSARTKRGNRYDEDLYPNRR